MDVNTADENPVIGTRVFGADPQRVAAHAAAAVTGLQSTGVAACAKHFPGHGATVADSHLELPTVDVPVEVLRRRDLPPFAAAVAAGARAVMTAHIRVPALTGDAPATFSRAVLVDLLRGELGFTGVVVTDALEMKGATLAAGGVGPGAVRALAAGADLLCIGATVDAALVEQTADADRHRRHRRAAAARPAGGGRRPHRGAGRLGPAGAAGRPSPRPTSATPSPAAPSGSKAASTAWPGRWCSGCTPAPRSCRSACRGGSGRTWTTARSCGSSPPRPTWRRCARSPASGRSWWWGGACTGFPRRAALVEALAAAHPVTVVEMGWPASWRPADARAFVITYGASHANGRAAAELLGLIPNPAA